MIKEDFKACFHTRNHKDTRTRKQQGMQTVRYGRHARQRPCTHKSVRARTHAQHRLLCLSVSLCTALGFTFSVCLVYRCWSCLAELAVKRQTHSNLLCFDKKKRKKMQKSFWISAEAANIRRSLWSFVWKSRRVFLFQRWQNWLLETRLTNASNTTMYFFQDGERLAALPKRLC